MVIAATIIFTVILLTLLVCASFKAGFCKCGGKYRDLDYVHWKCDKCGHIIDMGTW